VSLTNISACRGALFHRKLFLLLFVAFSVGAVARCGGGSQSHCTRDSECGSAQWCEPVSHLCVLTSQATPPFSVTTESLPEGVVGERYEQDITVRGGQLPYLWSFSSRSDRLDWLQLDTNRGKLYGTPTGPINPAVPLTIRVDDSSSRSARQSFILSVRTCNENEIFSCRAAVAGACYTGFHICHGGAFGPCEVATPSIDLSRCGANCGACGTSADRCTNGLCRCGSTDACRGVANICCSTDAGVGCVDVRTNPDSCGACGAACDRDRIHVTRTCTAGACQYPCAPGWGRCTPVRGCETDLTTPENCSTCGNRCPPPRGEPGSGRATCVAGRCGFACSSGFHLCGDTCYRDQDPNHCGPACRQCPVPVDGWATCEAGQCVPVCPPGLTLCNGACVDTMTDPFNCRICGNRCRPPTPSCIDGQCRPDP
jgi:hypothetical protein